jgi:hypothetical protein
MEDIVAKLRSLYVQNNTDCIKEAADEIERLRRGGCARDQGLTKYCAEAAFFATRMIKLENEILRRDEECYKRCGVCEFDYGRAAPKSPNTDSPHR